MSSCSEDRKLAFLKRIRIRKSCSECYRYGTEKCVRIPEGFVCQCRTNWTEPTCWRAPNLCQIDQVDCGENGRCVSEITRARCVCDETFAGAHCTVNKTRLSFISDTEASFVSGTTGSALVLITTGLLVLVPKGLLAFLHRGNPDDPQWYYQNLRCFFVLLGGVFSLLFRHPALLQISHRQCAITSFMTTCSFLFGMAFFALEALNFYECASLTQLNSWTEPFWGRQRWFTSQAFRTLTPLVVLTAAVVGIFKSEETTSAWSCLGRFEAATRDFWFPIVLAHSCLGLAALAFTLEGMLKRKSMPQFQQVVEQHLKPLPSTRGEEVEKCQRNHGLTAIGPWLLFTTWLFLALSADWIVTPVNYWAVACSLAYSACELTIFILTTPRVYNAITGTFTKNSSGVGNLTRKELKTNHRQPRKPKHRGKRYPAKAGSLQIKLFNQLRRRWTAWYKKLREKNVKKTKAQIIFMIYHSKLKQDLYSRKRKACRKRVRLLFGAWWKKTYKKDTQPDAVLKLKTRVDMYLEERAALMENLAFLGGQGIVRDQLTQQEGTEISIPICYASTIDSCGNTEIEEVMKTPAKNALRLACPRRERGGPPEDGGERGNISMEQNEAENTMEWIEKLTDSTFKMAVQNYDYLERSRSLREWGPPLK